jgi:hypothetical protein
MAAELSIIGGKIGVQTSGNNQPVMSEVLRGIPQFIQAATGTVPQMNSTQLSCTFLFIIHDSNTKRYMLCPFIVVVFRLF